MSRVLTNTTSFSVARESVVGTIPTSGWKLLEPNGVNQFGAEITTVARSPISNRRQRRKGTVTDLDSGFEYEADFTQDVFEDFIEAFLFANAANGDLTFRGADVTSSGFTVPALTASQGARLQFDAGGPISLMYSRGYLNAANNGLIPLTVDPVSTDTVLEFSGAVAETAPTNAVAEVAGIRATAGDLALAVSSGIGTLSSGNNSVTGSDQIDFTTLGLTLGQYVHVGGLTSANQFGSTAAGDGTRSLGYARVIGIAAAALTLDKLTTLLVASDGTDDGSAGTLIPVDLLFGKFIRNVPVGSTDYAEITHTAEAVFPNLDNPSGDKYRYSRGLYADTLALNLPLTDKATCTVGFIGLDTDNPTTTRATGASSARDPQKTGAFNTTSDFLRLRVTLVDETGLTTDFKNVTLTLANGVSPEKVLGVLGAQYINFSNFEVNLEGQVVFTNSEVIDAIRDNTTVTMDFGLKNDDGAIWFDIPAMTLGGGDNEFPVDESVLLNLTGEAFEDPTLSTSLGVSTFPVIPS